MDLRAIVEKLWLRRWWLIASVSIFVAAFVAAAFLMTPMYRASVVLIPASADRFGLNGAVNSALGSLGGLASLAGINVGSANAQLEEALAVLRSRQFTEAFIRDKQLMPKLFPKHWDAKAGKWSGAAERQPTMAQAANRFSKLRSISNDKRTGLIVVQIEWEDPDEAASWANDLVSRLNEEMRLRAIADTSASLSYLQKELSSTSIVGTREAINRLIEAQINQKMIANVTGEYALRVVDKAMAPDITQMVKPKKTLLFGLGLALGLMFGVICILGAELWSADRGSNV